MDINKLASRITKKTTEEKNPHAQALGRLGGLIGHARAKKLSARRKKEIAKKAAKTRWTKIGQTIKYGEGGLQKVLEHIKK